MLQSGDKFGFDDKDVLSLLGIGRVGHDTEIGSREVVTLFDKGLKAPPNLDPHRVVKQEYGGVGVVVDEINQFRRVVEEIIGDEIL